ncbi:MAG: hypothetical protein GEV28_21755 [Actinophytocola sp.]|uniref:hypothetical protein n=1 Tax=Actinophytocola sp. TaxID=1872138 RepID=UPI00132C7B65|nr:hypothetical protein [Actinophytocola sp.]MPZ82879.1 hypothetical protein [Actinophytocola sp.]
MPDPSPNDGFTANLNDADKAATQSLPAAASLIRDPVTYLVSLVDFEGANVYRAADRATNAFGLYKEGLGRRQRDIARVVDETAEALKDIVNVYRRVDGQVRPWVLTSASPTTRWGTRSRTCGPR